MAPMNHSQPEVAQQVADVCARLSPEHQQHLLYIAQRLDAIADQHLTQLDASASTRAAALAALDRRTRPDQAPPSRRRG